MPRSKKSASSKAVGATDVAPPRPVAEAPDSLLSRTSTTHDEQEALASKTYATVNLEELEMRIGLSARIVLEHWLRVGPSQGLSPKDKCDVALRAITVLEGSKQEIAWRDDLRRRPKKITQEAYNIERKETEERLRKLLLREAELKVDDAQKALDEIEEDSTLN